MAFNKKSIEGFFSFVKTLVPLKTNDNPDGFYFLPKYLFDSTLDFENELKRYTVKNNTALNLQNINWLGIVWKRGVITDSNKTLNNRKLSVLRSNLTDPTQPKGTFYRFSMVQCPFTVRFFSNNLDYLEDFEEYFFNFVKDQTTFNVLFPQMSASETTKVLISELKLNDVLKINRGDSGDICYYEISFNLHYPITLDTRLGEKSLIGQGKIDIITTVLNKSDPFPIP